MFSPIQLISKKNQRPYKRRVFPTKAVPPPPAPTTIRCPHHHPPPKKSTTTKTITTTTKTVVTTVKKTTVNAATPSPVHDVLSQHPPAPQKRKSECDHEHRPTKKQMTTPSEEEVKKPPPVRVPIQDCMLAVDKLAHRWNLKQEYVTLTLNEAAQHFFTFNDNHHGMFGMAVEETWARLNFPSLTRPDRPSLVYTDYTVRDCQPYYSQRTQQATHEHHLMDMVEMTHLRDTDHTLYRMRRYEYQHLLSEILAAEDEDSWCSSIHGTQSVPSALMRVLLLLRIPMNMVFPRMAADAHPALPVWFNLCSNGPRMEYHLNNTVPRLRIEETDLLLDALHGKQATRAGDSVSQRNNEPMPLSRPADDSSSSNEEDEEEDRWSNNETTTFYTSVEARRKRLATAMRLRPDTDSVKIHFDPRARETPRDLKGIHPYALSGLAFAMAAHAHQMLFEVSPEQATRQWSISRIYLFFRAWLAYDATLMDQLVVNLLQVPPVLLERARALLDVVERVVATQEQVSNPLPESLPMSQHGAECLQLLDTWGGSLHTLFRMHQARQPTSGKFISFRLFSGTLGVAHADAPPEESLNNQRHVLNKMHTEFLVPPASLHGKRVMVLNRRRVHPLAVRHSLDVLQRWFFDQNTQPEQRHKLREWPIYFDERHVYVVAPDRELLDILRFCNPYVPCSQLSFARQICFPLHLHHLHGFFHGGRKGIMLCIKFIMKSMGMSNSSYALQGAALESKLQSGRLLMPTSDEDPLVDSYRLLPHLLDRFGSERQLWSELVNPFKSVGQLFTDSKANVRGLRDQSCTLYHALRAFVLVHAKHHMMAGTAHHACAYMIKTAALQVAFPLAFKLLLYLRDAYPSAADATPVAIPQDFFEGSSSSPSSAEEGEIEDCMTYLRTAPHLVIYQMCADVRCPDELAVDLFLSVGCTLAGRERDKGTRSNPIYLSASMADKACSTQISTDSGALVDRMEVATSRLARWCYGRRKLKAIDDENLEDRTPVHSPALLSLLRSMEELNVMYTTNIPAEHVGNTDKAPTYRGHAPPLEYVHRQRLRTLDAAHLLMESRLPPPFPLDWDPVADLPLTSDRCFPVWSSGFMELSEHPDNQDGSRRVDSPSILAHITTDGSRQHASSLLHFQLLAKERRPLVDAHPELVPEVILHPITEVCLHAPHEADPETFFLKALREPVSDLQASDGWLDVRHFSSTLEAVSSTFYSTPSTSPTHESPPPMSTSTPTPTSTAATEDDPMIIEENTTTQDGNSPSLVRVFSLHSTSSPSSSSSSSSINDDIRHPSLKEHQRAFARGMMDRKGWRDIDPVMGPSFTQVATHVSHFVMRV